MDDRFVCMKCNVPLHITFDDLQYIQLITNLLQEQLDTKSLTLLSHISQHIQPNQRIAQHIHNVVALLFKVASDTTGIQLPLCDICMSKSKQELSQSETLTKNEKEGYSQILSSLNSHSSIAPDKWKVLEERECQIQMRLENIRKSRAELDHLNGIIDSENEALQSLESTSWKIYRDFEVDHEQFNSEFGICIRQIQESKKEYAMLEHTNVLDDTFHIFYDGHFGTINGFRLGRLQSQQVGWSEINAALGQCVLLLESIAKAVDFKFTKYDLQPRGSFSRIIRKKDHSTYDLFGQKKSFWFHNFDHAITYFLFCLRELGDYAEADCGRCIFKYPISDDTVGGFSVKLHANQDEKSTKALKYMLLDLKSLLYWCARKDQ